MNTQREPVMMRLTHRVDGVADDGDEIAIAHFGAVTDASERALGFDHAGRDPSFLHSVMPT